MSRLEASVRIDVSPAVAWSYVQDTRRRMEWDRRVLSVENLTGLPLGVGSRLRVTFLGMFSMRFWMEGTYHAFRPGHLSTIRFEKTSPLCPFVSAGGAWSFTPEGDGTRFATRFRYELRGGRPARLFDAAFVRGRVRRETEESLQLLKERLEHLASMTRPVAHPVTC